MPEPVLIANGSLETASNAGPSHVVTSLFFAIICNATLAGCAEFNGRTDSMPRATSTTTHRSAIASRKLKIPLPDRALLKPQHEPDCGLQVAQSPNKDERAATSGMETGSISRGGPSAELAQRIALEYERECYRMAEARVRTRLRQLQFSMARMARAVRRAEHSVR